MACANICPEQCISMPEDTEGFWYPVADPTKCSHCGLCEKVCPEINLYNNPGSYSSTVAYAARNPDPETRKKSSAGGFFPTLAKYVIDKGGIVIGAAYDADMEVVHTAIHLHEDISDLQGSKFAQSDMGSMFQQARKCLETGVMVLFCGTPCQIAALYNFLGKDYEKLITCDIICKGVPSPKIFAHCRQYFDEKLKSKVTGFRYNKESGKNSGKLTLELNRRTHRKVSARNAFMTSPAQNYCYRPSCYSCSYHDLLHPADITMGEYPDNSDQDPLNGGQAGMTLVMLNTHRGEKIAGQLRRSLEWRPFEITTQSGLLPRLITTAREPALRARFFDDFNREGYRYAAGKYFSKSGPKSTNAFYSTIKRMFF